MEGSGDSAPTDDDEEAKVQHHQQQHQDDDDKKPEEVVAAPDDTEPDVPVLLPDLEAKGKFCVTKCAAWLCNCCYMQHQKQPYP